MNAEDERNANVHDRKFSCRYPAVPKWFYHKTHMCMCIDQPSRLLNSQWPISPIIWLTFRISIASLITLILLFDFANTILYQATNYGNTFKYFIYLTNWGLILLTISFMTKVYIMLKYFTYLETNTELDKIPPLFIFSWITTNISNMFAFFVTIGYWGIVYQGEQIRSVTPINSHIINVIIVILDLSLSEAPIYIAHFYQPFLFGLFYLLFTFIYYKCGGTSMTGKRAIYSTLNWDNPVGTILFGLVGGSFACFLIHFLTAITSWARTRIAKRVGHYVTKRAQRSTHPL